LFGDDRGRGPALINLTEYFKEFGLQADERELPNYLPLLEFSSTLEETEAQVFMNQTVKVLTQLAANLEKSASPYAPLIWVIEQRGQLGRRWPKWPVAGCGLRVAGCGLRVAGCGLRVTRYALRVNDNTPNPKHVSQNSQQEGNHGSA
jgi:hypothetical protein